jgi:hypothetical protein
VVRAAIFAKTFTVSKRKKIFLQKMRGSTSSECRNYDLMDVMIIQKVKSRSSLNDSRFEKMIEFLPIR